jgi:hypothetical protein
MKKIVFAAILGLFASSMAFACPKGSHMEGGTGPHHKGGKCVANSDAKAKPAAKPAKAAPAAPQAEPAALGQEKPAAPAPKNTNKATPKAAPAKPAGAAPAK